MGKKDEYRFNLRFDETDEMHRLVVKYLNSCGHNKAKYIVRAFLAYWKMSGKSLLSYVFPEIDAEQLLPEAKPENDKKTAVVAKASDAGNDNGTYIQKDHSEQQLFDDIGGILNMTAKQAENSYYNAIRKIRKQMGDNFG